MDNRRRFHRDIALFALANFLWPFGQSMYINFFPIHIRQLGGSELVVGLAVSIPFFAGVLCLIGGIMADFTDRKKILLFGWAVTIPAPLIWAFADRWEWMLVGAFVYSLTMVCASAITLYIFDYETTGNKMQAYTYFSLSAMMGAILGPFIGGAILGAYDSKLLYLLIFVCYSLATLCVLPLSGQPRPKHRNFRHYLKWGNIASSGALKKTALILLFLSTLSLFMNISGPYMPLFLDEVKAMPVDRIGLVFTVLSLGAALFIWLFGKLDARLGMRTNLLLGIGIFLLSITITACTSNFYFLLFAFFLRGIVTGIAVYVVGGIAERLTGDSKGLLLSMYVAVRSILIGVAAYPGAFLYPIHPHLLFYTEAILLALWALVVCLAYFGGFWKKNAV